MSGPHGSPGSGEPAWDPSRPPPPSAGWPPEGGPTPGQYGGSGGPPPPPRQTEGLAIVALVLAVASFVVCPVIPAVAALIVGNRASDKIRSSGGWLDGEGLVPAARIVSWINIGLFVLACIGFLVAIAVTANDDSSMGLLAPG